MAQKFIINNGNLVLGTVDYHNQLSKDHSTTKGGGLWHVDNESKKLYLWGASVDFGSCKTEDLVDVMSNGLISPFLDGYEVLFTERLATNGTIPEEKHFKPLCVLQH